MIKILVVLPLLIFSLIACNQVPPELLEKRYSQDQLMEQICSTPKQCAETDSEIWFIDQGYLFSYDKKSWTKSYKKGFDVKMIVNYKGVFVGLQFDGDVYITAKDESGSLEWHSIGNNGSEIFVVNNDLVALTFNKELWRYKGTIGELIWTFVPILIPQIVSCGKNCSTTTFTTIIVPTVAGREIAFENTGLKNVVSARETDGDLEVIFSKSPSDASKIMYSQL